MPAGRPLRGFETVLAEVTAAIDIDFVAGDSRAPGDVGVSVDVDIAPVTVYRLLKEKGKNDFPGHKVKGQWRFFKVDVDQWVRANR